MKTNIRLIKCPQTWKIQFFSPEINAFTVEENTVQNLFMTQHFFTSFYLVQLCFSGLLIYLLHFRSVRLYSLIDRHVAGSILLVISITFVFSANNYQITKLTTSVRQLSLPIISTPHIKALSPPPTSPPPDMFY